MGVGRRLKMITKLKAFRDRFCSDFGSTFNAKIESKSVSRAIKIQSRASSISPIFTNENEDAAGGSLLKNQSNIAFKTILNAGAKRICKNEPKRGQHGAKIVPGWVSKFVFLSRKGGGERLDGQPVGRPAAAKRRPAFAKRLWEEVQTGGAPLYSDALGGFWGVQNSDIFIL